MTDVFLTPRNFDNCMGAFCRYMWHQHSVRIGPDMRTRQLLLNVMTDVLDQFLQTGPDMPLKSLNNTTFSIASKIVLKSTRDIDKHKDKDKVVVAMSKPTSSVPFRAPQIAGGSMTVLDRERMVHGDRPPVMHPHGTRSAPPTTRRDLAVDAHMQAMVASSSLSSSSAMTMIDDTDDSSQRHQQQQVTMTTITDDKLAIIDADARMKALESSRIEIDRLALIQHVDAQAAFGAQRRAVTVNVLNDRIEEVVPLVFVDPDEETVVPEPQITVTSTPIAALARVVMASGVSGDSGDDRKRIEKAAQKTRKHHLQQQTSNRRTAVLMTPQPQQPQQQTVEQMLATAPRAPRTLQDRYVTINSFDRQWDLNEKLRYRYTVRVGGYLSSALRNTYRDVHSLQVTRVIVPMEIVERSATTQQVMQQQDQLFYEDMSFSFPYIGVLIDGIDDVYDGTDDVVRSACCHLVYHRSYKAPNGRGYVILQPAQDERKVFLPTPLASLHNMALSLVRPNGVLMNDSLDDYCVQQIIYDRTNPLFIQITTNKFFEKNQFYIGDTVQFRKYDPAIDVDADIISPTDVAGYAALASFVNRDEGHEVVLLGEPNENGYYQIFYVLAPSTFDAVAGRRIVDSTVTAAIDASHSTVRTCCEATCTGSVLNMSLQNVVMMRVTVWT